MRIFVLSFVWVMIGCNANKYPVLRIAASANMQFAAEEIVSKFKDQFDISSEIIIGSSGKLTAQIMEGAPFDIFLSADKKYPEQLVQDGRTSSEPILYARGTLVLWTMDEHVPLSLSNFAESSSTRVAIANPLTAPYGKAAVDYLENAGLYSDIEDHLVFGESLAQINQFAFSRATTYAITSKSAVLSDNLQAKGRWMDLDTSDYPAINQYAISLNTNLKLSKEIQLFQQFLVSAEGKKILRRYGYIVE